MDNLLSTESGVGLLAKIQANAKWVAIDTETTISDFRAGEGTVRGISLAYEVGGTVISFYLPVGHYTTEGFNENVDLQAIGPYIQEILDTKNVIFHNAQFDLMILEYLGFDTSRCEFFCTMVLVHLINENLIDKGLDYCSKHYLNDPGKQKSKEFTDIVKYAGWDFLPASIMAPYASWDANMTYRLYWHIQPTVKSENLGSTWLRKRAMIRVLIKMGKRGIKIDVPLAKEMEARGYEEMVRIQTDKLGGRSPGKRKDLEEMLWTELKLPVIRHEKTNQPTFDKNAMAEYEQLLETIGDESDLARHIIEWRGWQKATTAYYKPYQQRVSSDGRLRCNYKLHGTKTGRLSSAEPNLQQIPKETEKPWNGDLKKCFIPETGYQLWEFDYSQLELRLATAFAKIPSLLEIFSDPSRDIFTEMSKALGMSRPDTKTLVYAIQYGAGATHLAKVFRVSYSVAKERIETFYGNYPEFRQLAQRASMIALREKKLKIWSGRYRHFDNPKMQAHKAFNSFIQGGAADIVETQMVRLDRELVNEECRMLLQVHDSLIFEVKSEQTGLYLPQIKSIMEDVKPDFGVVFRVDTHKFGGDYELAA